MFKTIIISNSNHVANDADKLLIDYIMVDLEVEGKAERQKSRNTFISTHTINDVKVISKTLTDKKCSLIVRINPYSSKSESELKSLSENKIDYIMLPMIQRASDVNNILKIMDSLNMGPELIPLIEHINGLNSLTEIIDQNKVLKKIYFGLNDLSLSLNLPFMFQCLTEGYISKAAKICLDKKIEFGFGGIGLLDGDNAISAKKILLEHVFLKSKMAILSRSFKNNFDFLQNSSIQISSDDCVRFKNEVLKIKYLYSEYSSLDEIKVKNMSSDLHMQILNFVSENS